MADHSLEELAENAALACEKASADILKRMASYHSFPRELPHMGAEVLRLLDTASALRARAVEGEGR